MFMVLIISGFEYIISSRLLARPVGRFDGLLVIHSLIFACAALQVQRPPPPTT